jgi:hypothetical protein
VLTALKRQPSEVLTTSSRCHSASATSNAAAAGISRCSARERARGEGGTSTNADGPGGPAHREIWLRDLDGYLVVLASPDGESPWPDPRVG